MTEKNRFYVYMIRMKDDRIYTGYTEDFIKRFIQHNEGNGCRTTKIFGTKELIFLKQFDKKEKAMKYEKQLKKYGKKRKTKIIKENIEEIKEISKLIIESNSKDIKEIIRYIINNSKLKTLKLFNDIILKDKKYTREIFYFL